jgi:hypothetical protein
MTPRYSVVKVRLPSSRETVKVSWLPNSHDGGEWGHLGCAVSLRRETCRPAAAVIVILSKSSARTRMLRAHGTGMQYIMRITNYSVEVRVQRDFYSRAIGSSSPAGVINDIVAFSEDAKTPDRYDEDEYWYEMPEKEGLEQKVRAIADMWLEVGDRGPVSVGHPIDTSARTKRTSSEPRNMSADLLAR